MKLAIKIFCVLAIYFPFQLYYESHYHQPLGFGTGFIVALVAFGTANGIIYFIEANKRKSGGPQDPNIPPGGPGKG